MDREPSALNFVRAFGDRWFEYMSGGPSVPLMLAALLIDNRALAIGTGLTGIICAVLAAYFVWASERRKVLALQRRIGGVAPALAKLRTDGVKIRNDAINGFAEQAGWDDWWNKATAWNTKVIEAIRPISEARAEWFSVLDVYPPARTGKPLGGKRELEWYNMHDYRLLRLDGLIFEFESE